MHHAFRRIGLQIIQQDFGAIDADLQLSVADFQVAAHGRHVREAHLIASPLLAVDIAPFGIIRGLTAQVADHHPAGRAFIRSIQDGTGFGQVIILVQIGPLRLVKRRFQTLPGLQTEYLYPMRRNLASQFPASGAQVFPFHQVADLHGTVQLQGAERHRKVADTVRGIVQGNRAHRPAFLSDVLHQDIASAFVLHHISLQAQPVLIQGYQLFILQQGQGGSGNGSHVATNQQRG